MTMTPARITSGMCAGCAGEGRRSVCIVHLTDDAPFVLMLRGARQSLAHRFEFERHNRIDRWKDAWLLPWRHRLVVMRQRA